MPHPGRREGIRPVCGDVSTFQYPDDKCSSIIHAAASSIRRGFAHEHGNSANTITNGTRHVLEMAAHQHVQVSSLSARALGTVRCPEMERVSEPYACAPDSAPRTAACR